MSWELNVAISQKKIVAGRKKAKTARFLPPQLILVIFSFFKVVKTDKLTDRLTKVVTFFHS